MKMETPDDLVWLLVALVASAAILAGAAREGRWIREGRIHPWILFEDLVGYFLFMGMFVASTMQILVRYALSDVYSAPWTEEFARLVMVWLAFWGAAAVQRSDDHISMTVLVDFMPDGLRRWVRLAGDLIIVIALCPVIWYGWQTARSLDIMFSISLGWPLSVFAYPVPIGGALVLVHTLRLMVLRARGRTIPSETAD